MYRLINHEGEGGGAPCARTISYQNWTLVIMVRYRTEILAEQAEILLLNQQLYYDVHRRRR